jgi:hypothetical protein
MISTRGSPSWDHMKKIQLAIVIAVLCSASGVTQWRKGPGEEQLVYDGEFRAAEDRNKEVQGELKAFANSNRTEIINIKERLNNLEWELKRLNTVIDAGMRVLWAFGGLIIIQIVIPLLRRGLHSEIQKIKVEK